MNTTTRFVAAFSAAFATFAAHADYDFAIERFEVSTDVSAANPQGTPVFTDEFADGKPPTNQMLVPNRYTVRGEFDTEANGQLRLNSTDYDNGFASTSPDGRNVFIQMAVLNNQYRATDSFTVNGLFRYDVPLPTQVYGLRLQDTTPFNMGNDTMGIDVGWGTDGQGLIRLHEFNFETGEVITVGRSLITRDDVAWVGLSLSNALAGAPDIVTASFVLYDANMSVLDTQFVMSDANPAVRATSRIFEGETFTRASFYAVELAAAPVPEASTWGMLLAGLGAVGVAVRRRRG